MSVLWPRAFTGRRRRNGPIAVTLAGTLFASSAVAEPVNTPATAPPYDPYVSNNATVSQATPQTDDRWGVRTMAGHTFLYPIYVESAFIASYVGIRAAVAFTTVSNVPSRYGTFSLSITGAAETLDVGVKITDFIGVNLVGIGRAVLGSNFPALIYNGATYNYGGALRVPFRIARIEKTATQLTIVPYASFTKGQIASFLFIVQNRPATTVVSLLQGELGESLRTPLWSTTYGGNLALAQGIGKYVGVQAEAGVGGYVVTLQPFDPPTNQRIDSVRRGVQYQFGVEVEGDAAPAGVPVAAQLEYQLSRRVSTADSIPDSDPDTTHNFAAGLYYSGRRNLQVGAAFGLQFGINPIQGDLGNSERPVNKNIYFILRYVF